ncbi:MAG TPA: hypothetical protein VGN36_03800 [Sphingorhabdus sp.]|jgi:hypothetical protein|nr:hypothetical protein [Sphingorhabdus sp.]
MTKRKASEPNSGKLNAATRKRFLDHLAQTANVTASARVAGTSRDAVYAERRRLADFSSEWAVALAEGYVRLETDLLADALRPASSKTSDAMLKAKAQKQRLQLGLLAAHRGAVKGGAVPPPIRAAKPDLPALKAQLILKLTQMRDRAGLPLDD